MEYRNSFIQRKGENRMESGKRAISKDTLFALIIVIVFTLGSLFYLHRSFDLILCSDESSELILGKLIVEEHRLIPNNWYYSTELRVLNNPMIYALAFHITDNWHAVRLLSFAILYLIISCAVFFYAKSIGCRSLFPVFLVPFLIPTSLEYYRFVLWGGYYIPYIVVSLLGFSLVFFCSSGEKTHAKRSLYAVPAFILALLSSCNGPRQIFGFYGPLFMAAVLFMLLCRIEKQQEKFAYAKRFLSISLVSLVGAGCGYLLNNTVLRTQYSYFKYNLSFYPITREVFFRAFRVFRAFFAVYGYRMGGTDMATPWANIIAWIIFLMAVCAILYALIHRRAISKEYLLLTLFFLSSGACLVLLYSFTSMSLTPRYMIMTAVFAFSLITLWIKEAHYFRERMKQTLNIGLTLLILINAMTTVVYCDLNSHLTRNSEDRLRLAEVLKEKGYFYGYASYWEANILTEISNGEIEMQHWYVGIDELYGHQSPTDEQYINGVPLNHAWEWLQYKTHTTETPSGKVFILFTQGGYSYYDDKDLLSDDQIIYESDVYRVYGFDSYQEMESCIRS